VARAEAYLHANFYLDQSKRLATVHQRHRQADTGQRSDGIGRTVLQTVAQKRHVETSRNFLYMLSVSVSWSSGDSAICYLLPVPVMWITSCFYMMNHVARGVGNNDLGTWASCWTLN